MKQLIITSILSLLLFACSSQKKEEAAKETNQIKDAVTLTDEQLRNAGIESAKPEWRSITSVLKVSGKIDVPPQNMVSISVPLGGYLKSMNLLPGMPVKKGEVLAVMQDQQYIQLQQDYLSAKAQFQSTETEYLRQKELNKTKASSDKQLEQISAAYEMQRIAVRALAEKLRLLSMDPDNVRADNISRNLNIYSPISGFVSEVKVNIGKYVNPSDVLFELVNPSDIHLALTVFEKDLDKLYVGQKLLAYTNNDPAKKYPCKIILISRNLSGERAAEVHCHFDKYDHSLLPGMYMNADIELKNAKVLALPDDAIVSYENKNYVFLRQDQHSFQLVEVQIGSSENGYTEIMADSTWSGKNFVTKGAYSLLMKMKNASEE